MQKISLEQLNAELVPFEELEFQEDPSNPLSNDEISDIIVGIRELFNSVPNINKIETGKFIVDDRFKLFAEFMGLVVETYNPKTFISTIAKKGD